MAPRPKAIPRRLSWQRWCFYIVFMEWTSTNNNFDACAARLWCVLQALRKQTAAEAEVSELNSEVLRWDQDRERHAAQCEALQHELCAITRPTLSSTRRLTCCMQKTTKADMQQR